MKYILDPSALEHIALIKIVVTLWKQKDICDLISNSSDSLSSEWQDIEDRVIKNVPQLPVPEIMKEKIISLVKPVGLQILKWIQYHCTGGYFHKNALAELCWTPQGTIDREKTAEVLIRDESLDIIKRYKLACIYCLEDSVVQLWNNIPESCQQSLLSEYSAHVSQNLMSFHWTHIMQEGYNNPLYSYQYKFESCAKGGNKAATKYFLGKLTLSEREESLVKTATSVKSSEVLFFLLSQMNEEQEREVFKSNPYYMLLHLLEWPSQNLFIAIADRMWEILLEWQFDRLLKRIFDRIRIGYKDYNYEKLFEMFWQKSPSNFKNYVTGGEGSRLLLPHFFRIKDKDKMKFLFQDATFIEKKKCIYSYTIRIIFQEIVLEEEWDFLRFLIEEWVPSGIERTNMQEEFEINIETEFLGNHYASHRDKWDQLFLPSKFDLKCNKRELEDCEIPPSKAPHIIQ